MAMSDCTRCWETPCSCGHEYQQLWWTKKKKIDLISAVSGLTSEEVDKKLFTKPDLGVTMELLYEDPRYPTLVLQSEEFGTVGYSLNLSTGELNRVCICNAYSSNECICGAWHV